MADATTLKSSATIRAYWVPGCSSCLRMKEFLQKSGKDFEAINVEARPEEAEVLRSFAIRVPAIVCDGRAASGLDLAGVAELIGVAYTLPRILPARVLRQRYSVVTETACALISQLS